VAGSALVAVARDERGRFLKGAIGNPQGWQRSKRVTQLYRVETYPEPSRVIHETPWWKAAKADAT
jgi:hypothetical protein